MSNIIFKCFLLPVFFFTSLTQALPNSQENGIEWLPWQVDSFTKAKQEGKLILINVGMEGCTACNRMERITYQNPEVTKLIKKDFVAISVDSQARPDIGERYSDWAWPATVFLLPDTTQVFAMAGNRLPHNFLPLLKDLQNKHEQGELKADVNAPYTATFKPITTELSKIRDQVRFQLDRSYNANAGGWSNWGVNAEASGARLQHLYWRAHLYRKDRSVGQDLLASALKVSDSFIQTLDPVWGGAYEANIVADAEDVPEEFNKLRAVPEKRISSQANALIAFAQAYQQKPDVKYKHAAAEIDRFLTNWLLSPEQTWYANQKDTAPKLPNDWWPQDYWLLDSDKKRRVYGVPPVDHAIYTDKNAEVALAYLQAYDAFDKKEYLTKAINATESLISTRLQRTGWIKQTIANQEIQDDQRVHLHSDVDKPFLRPQAKFGQLMLQLYQHTAQEKWMHHAVRIADAMLFTLHDPKLGGFWGTQLDDTAKIIAPRKPLEDNAIAASFFYDLYVLTKTKRFKDIARTTIRAVASDDILRREGKAVGETALLLEKMVAHYVEFTIVTTSVNDSKAKTLYQAALQTYHPRKLLHFQQPGRYPDLGKATGFICNPNSCSVPIFKTSDITKTADRY